MKFLPAMLLAASTLASTPATPAVSCAETIPYQIAARKLPAGTLVGDVLPAKIGRFVREAVRPGTVIPSNEDFNITYRAGKDSVFIGLSLPGSGADLKEAVRTSREDAVSDKSIERRGELYCTASPPFFYKIPDFIAWTRGPYFFYADASSPSVLDEFMRAFPH